MTKLVQKSTIVQWTQVGPWATRTLIVLKQKVQVDRPTWVWKSNHGSTLLGVTW